MNEAEVKEKYGIGKKTGWMILIQMILVGVGLLLTVVAIVRNYRETGRLVVYLGQALACVTVLIFGLLQFRNRDVRQFRYVLNAYALLEALRTALLGTMGVPPVYAFLARFLLAVLACDCVLMAERCEQESSIQIAYALLVLEFVLYIVFLLGFPGIFVGRLNRFLPAVSLLIAGSVLLFQKGRLEQQN